MPTAGANVVELLFRLKADAAEADKTINDIKSKYPAAFNEISTVGQQAFNKINQEVNRTANTIPIIGPAVVLVSNSLLNLAAATSQVKTASEGTGVAFNSLLPLLNDLDKAFTRANSGNNDLFNTFKSLGILTKDSKGAFSADLEHLQTLATRFSTMSDAEGKAAIASDIFGAKAQKIVPVLEQWSKEGEQAANATANVGTSAAASSISIAAMAGPIALAVGAFAALAIGAGLVVKSLFSMTGQAADYGEEIFKAHQKTGIATESLSGLYVAAARVKVPFEQVIVALERVQRNAIEAEKGSKTLQRAFEDLHVSTKGAAQDSTKFIDDFITHVGNLKDGAEKVDVAFKTVSRSGANLIPFFNELKRGIKEFVDEAERMGLKLTEQQAKDLYQYNLALTKIGAQLKGLQLVIGKDFLPTAIQAVTSVSSLLQGIGPVISGFFKSTGDQISYNINYIKLLVALIMTIPDAWHHVLGTGGAIFTYFGTLAESVWNLAKAMAAIWTGDLTGAKAAWDKALDIQKAGIKALVDSATNSAAALNQAYAKNLSALYQPGPEVPEGGNVDPKLRPNPKKGESEETRLNRQLDILKKGEEKLQIARQDALEKEKISFEDRVHSMEMYTDISKKLEDAHYAAMVVLLEKERDLIKSAPIPEDLRAIKLEDIELRRQKAERARDHANTEYQRAFDKEERQRFEDHQKALLALQQEGDRARMDEIQRELTNERITYEQAERQREEIQLAAFRRREDQLRAAFARAGANEKERQKVQEDQAKLVAEREAFIDGTLDARQSSREQDINKQIQYAANLRKIQDEITDIVRSAQREQMDLEKLGLESRSAYIQRQAAYDRQTLRLAAEREKAVLEDEKARLAASNISKIQQQKQLEELEQKIHAIDLQLNSNEKKLDADTKRALALENPNSRRSLFGDTYTAAVEAYNKALEKASKPTNKFKAEIFGVASAAQEAFHNMAEASGNFTSNAISAFNDLTQGVGQLAEQFILTGEIGGQALRKLTAQIIAHYAATWIIKAIDLTAEGISFLAKASAAAAIGDVKGAALYTDAATKDFISAAKYGAAGTIAAVVGRGLAGDAFKQNSSSTTGTGASQGGGAGSGGPTNVVYGSSPQGEKKLTAAGPRTLIWQQMQDTMSGIHEQLSRLDSKPAGEVVTIGAPHAVAAIGQANVTHMRNDPTVIDVHQRLLGFDRG